MKKIVTGALAFLLITGGAQAQQAPGGKEQRKDRMEQLNLTAEQKQKLKSIREAHQKEWQELQKQDNITVKEWKARREELQKKQQAEMKTVLTPEQQQQLAKTGGRFGKEGARKEGGRKKGALRQKGGTPMQELNLTDAQKTKMQDLNKGFQAKREALRSNTALSEEQKREQIKTLAQQHRQEVKAVLTPEQAQKLDSIRGERRGKNGK